LGFCHIAKLPNEIYYGLFALLGTFIVYNFQRLIKYHTLKNHSPHIQWVEKHYKGLVFSIVLSTIGFVFTLFQVINWNIETIVLGSIVGAICVFYIVPIKNKSLREMPFLKIHLVSLVWVFIISLFPLINEQNIELNNWMFGATHYLYILAVCIPFDIRDLVHDDLKQKTIPQMIGLQSAKTIAILCLITFVFSAYYFMPHLAESKLFLIAVLIEVFLVYFTTKTRNDLYFGGAIDGAILLLGLSYFLV
jgi:uncharacterized membrane protein